MFTKDAALTKLTDKIEDLSKRVAELRGEKDQIDNELGLSAKVVSLEREKTRLEIEIDRVKESKDREKREIEHMVGLHKQRVEQEIELAKREQTVNIREENLKADRERFEEQMKFMQKRMEGELERLNGLTSEILERLPKVSVERRLEEYATLAGDRGNGGTDADL